MKGIWIEEPVDEEFLYENREDEEGNELLPKTKALTKQISRRRSMAVIVKWLFNHNKELHSPKEISEALKLNSGTVSFNLIRLANVGVVKITRLEGLDKHPLYSVNPSIGKLVTQRYLWLCSWKLLRTLPKRDNILLDELKSNSEFIEVIHKHRLSFQEAIESLALNHYIKLMNRGGQPYAIKLKETLPLKYYKAEEKKTEAIEIGVESEGLIEEL